ncbi:efflux RND transporter permease subunit [Roseimaritima sediminicola]|uniref:efflux RND transporter permease subunit n=1 Tax=Roseimaritima sediminicola TaxID=2662066 RepID=UPI00129842A5|nr:MMPL family transporter [Roseimaritima sediminicola]
MYRLSSPGPRPSRVASLLYVSRWFLVAVAAGVLLWARPRAAEMQIDRRIDQLFPAADPSVDAYHYLRENFGGNAIVLMVYADADLFTPAGIERAEQLGSRVAEVPGVRAAVTVSHVSAALEELRPLRLFGGERPPAVLDSNRVTHAFRQLFAGYTHNRDGDYGAVVVMLEPTDASESYSEAIARLREIAADLPQPLEDAVLVGQPVLVTEGYSLIVRDGRRLGTTTLWLLSAVLLILFRTVRWVLVAWAVIHWSTTVTRATAVTAGLQLSLVSSMLAAILTVVAVAAIIHVAIGWQQRRRRGDSLHEASVRTLSRLSPPILWAVITDAAGFAALLASNVGPVRDFGLLMAIGAAAVLLALILILPAALSLPLSVPTRPLPARQTGPNGSNKRSGGRWRLLRAANALERRLHRGIVRMTAALLRRRRWVIGIVVLLSVATAGGLVRLQAETNFLRNFRSTSEITTAYRLVEERFGGAGVWDVLVPAPSRSIDRTYMRSVRQLEQHLRDIRLEAHPEARVLHTLSIAKVDAAAQLSSNPLVRLATPDIRITRMRGVLPNFTRALLMPPSAREERYLRIMLRSPEDLSTEAKTELIAAVERVVAEHTQSDPWQQLMDGEPAAAASRSRVTGYYVLLARLVDRLLADQWTCLLLAATAVFVVLAVAARNLRWAALAMVPNLLPVLVTLAMLGWLGIPMNMGGAMIAAVSVGLTIDGTIHFLASYRRSRKRYGRTARQAALKAQGRVGLAILLSTLALVAGFSVLAASEFVPTATFGWLLSAAMALGMLANLTLLPVLLGRRVSTVEPFER